MTPEQIITKLDQLQSDPKTKNFLNHLVRNYIPFNKLSKVEESPKKDFFDTITKKDLISSEDWYKTTESIHNDATLKEPIQDLLDNEELALTGQNTNTYMSFKTYKVFYEWIVNKVIAYDKHILYLLGNINRKEFINNYKGIKEEQNKITKIKPVNSYLKSDNKPTTFSLGDFESLKQLKDKLK